MFWILRRTGAANFFNSLNNNCSTSKGNNNTGTQDKYVKRPPRKAYGRLSADSDDASSMKHNIDDPFDDLDNFAVIAPGGGSTNGNGISATRTSLLNENGNAEVSCPHAVDDGDGGEANGNGVLIGGCGLPDCQGNFVDGDLCDLNMAGLYGAVGTGGLLKSNSSSQRQKEVNQNTINRLQAMAMSDDDDYDESLTCNVCDRAFHCHRQLASHQQKKRHFGCSACDSLFPSLMLLEHHKEEFEHWSDDEISRRICCRRNRGDDYFTDTDSFTSEAESEDLERLL